MRRLGAVRQIAALRWTAALLAAVLLAGGVYGAWAYGHNYYVYRGFNPPQDPVGVAPGKTVTEHFFSRAFRKRRMYLAYLPPGYDAAAARGVRFPVLYLLHGSPGSPDLYINAGGIGVELDKLISSHKVKPFILVIPDGRDGSFRSNTEWANSSHGPYETLVLETVHAADAKFATKRGRRYRAIAGLSEGGYGSINIALRHLGVFGIAESWSGYFEPGGKGPLGKASYADRFANSPALYVNSLQTQLKKKPFYAFLYGGRHDRGSRVVRPFALKLRAAGGHVVSKRPRGGHNWSLWRRQIPASLRFAAKHFGAR